MSEFLLKKNKINILIENYYELILMEYFKIFKGNSSTKKIDFCFVFQADWTNITFNMDHFKAISLERITNPHCNHLVHN